MKWLIILQLTTGQNIALDIDSEQACRETLAKIESGTYTHITLENGLQLPIARGLGCERSDIFEAARGRI